MIRFPCQCGQELQVPDEGAGKKARCPACQAVCDVPAASPGDAAIQPASAPRAMPDERIEDGPRRLPRPDDDYSPAPRATSGKAITSLVLGILAILVCAIGPVLLGVPALILGILALGDIKKKRLTGQGMAITGIALSVTSFVFLVPALLIGLLLPAVQKVREAAARVQTQNNLKQIALAMHNYHDMNQFFPPPAIRSPEGKPLLSWRVAILPYIEQQDLYRRFHLDEPWDSPHNIKLLPLMPKVYRLAGLQNEDDDKTFLQVFVGPNTMFPNPPPGAKPPFGGPLPGVRIGEITDGTSNTILVIEAANAVPWTKPEDIPFTVEGPLPALGKHFPGGTQAAMADGAVRPIPPSARPESIKAAITRNGGELLGLDW
jgi:Protein of unknown function (DUF1559)/Domain of unknown function (DUF4190)